MGSKAREEGQGQRAIEVTWDRLDPPDLRVPRVLKAKEDSLDVLGHEDRQGDQELLEGTESTVSLDHQDSTDSRDLLVLKERWDRRGRKVLEDHVDRQESGAIAVQPE
mmetsp:Transcript_50840/g.158883  ORF Transcript_50840/g.158883 Transcript_50840/m.158883 type:complete len:108 (-) Transcript_50840:138-461(-)